MVYRYKRHGGSFRDTTSLDVLFCFIRDSILDDDMWDYECEFHDFLNENYGPATLEVRDYISNNGDIVCRKFNYADWLQEYCEEEYEEWYKNWLLDFADDKADTITHDLEYMKHGDEVNAFGITIEVLEEYQDVDD